MVQPRFEFGNLALEVPDDLMAEGRVVGKWVIGKWGSSGSGAASVLMPPGIAKTDDQDKGRFAPEKVENTGNPPFGAPPSFRLHGV